MGPIWVLIILGAAALLTIGLTIRDIRERSR
jgi:hypothetical protein